MKNLSLPRQLKSVGEEIRLAATTIQKKGRKFMRLRRHATVFLAFLLLMQAFPLAAFCEVDRNLSVSMNPIWASMGGSLSTQSLCHAIYRYWTGEDESSAARAIQFDRSDGPYQDLSLMASQEDVQNGKEAFLYFAFEPYGEEETRKELEETYEFVPIARDALVFLANTQNPVTDVSSQDMAKIYTGQIANWSELGGKDAMIKAFQRPERAYSQKMLKDTLMLGRPMAEPIVQWIHMEEGGLEPVPVSAAYDHSESALGFTMHYYTRDMFDSENTKELMIDHVMPNLQTIRSGRYPWFTTCYAIIPKKTPKDHPIRSLVAWLRTEEGQQVIGNAGFVPLMQPALEPQTTDKPPYPREATRQSCGTGGMLDRNQEKRVYSDDCLRGTGSKVWLTSGSAWEDLWIDLRDAPAMMESMEGWRRNAREELKLAAKGTEQTVEEYVFLYGNLVSFFDSVGLGTDTMIRTAVFDLKSGIKLQLSDLFLDGFNYIRYVNRFLLESSFREGTGALGDFSVEEQNLKGPFTGLPADYPYFVVTQQGELCLAFPGDNPWFQVPYDNLFFAPVPLWHEISPWGGCKVEQSYHVIESQNPRSVFYQLSLQIDGGRQPEAEQPLQAMEKACVETFTEVLESQATPYLSDDVVICQPFLEVYGQWLSVVYMAYEPEVVEYSPMIGGTVIDLHTGKTLLSDAQAKGMATYADAVIQRKSCAALPWEDMQPSVGYNPSEKAVVRGVWLSASNHKENSMDVNVDIVETDGSCFRITVPMATVSLR